MIKKGWIPVSQVVDMCHIDDYDDQQVMRKRFRNWVLRGYRKLSLNLLRKVKAVWLPVSKMNTVTLPEDYQDWLLVGYQDGCGQIVPMGLRTAVEEVPCECSCEKSICSPHYETVTEQVEMQGVTYEKTTKTIIQENGEIIREVTGPVALYNEAATVFLDYTFTKSGALPVTISRLETAAGGHVVGITYDGTNAAALLSKLNSFGVGTFTVSYASNTLTVKSLANQHELTALQYQVVSPIVRDYQADALFPSSQNLTINLPYTNGMTISHITVIQQMQMIETAVTGGDLGPLQAKLDTMTYELGTWTVSLEDGGTTLRFTTVANPYKEFSISYNNPGGGGGSAGAGGDYDTDLLRFDSIEVDGELVEFSEIFQEGNPQPLANALNALGLGTFYVTWSAPSGTLWIAISGSPRVFTAINYTNFSQGGAAGSIAFTGQNQAGGEVTVYNFTLATDNETVKQAVEVQTHSERLCEVEVLPCGCVADTRENAQKLVASGYYAGYCNCPQLCTDDYFEILEEARMITVGAGISKIYLKYIADLPCAGGEVYVPQVAAETLVAWALFKKDQRRNIAAVQKQLSYQDYKRERSELRKNVMRLRPEIIRAALNLIPY